MKKVYYAPFIIVTEVVLEQGFLMDSAHGASHEGFSESTNPPPHIDDGTDDDSPFSMINVLSTINLINSLSNKKYNRRLKQLQ